MVNILKTIEDKLSFLVEGAFDRTFTTPLHPVEIAKKITSSLDDSITVSGQKKSVPNYITILMPEEIEERIVKIAPEIIEQLKLYVTADAKEKGYTFYGPLEIVVEKGSRVMVAAENKSAEEDIALTDKEKQNIPSNLIIVDMENKTQSYIPLSADITIGRDLSSTIVIPSNSASRNHADIRKIDGRYVLRDLNSTNGTLLNGKKITASRIKVNDEILIAKTTIKVI